MGGGVLSLLAQVTYTVACRRSFKLSSLSTQFPQLLGPYNPSNMQASHPNWGFKAQVQYNASPCLRRGLGPKLDA